MAYKIVGIKWGNLFLFVVLIVAAVLFKPVVEGWYSGNLGRF